MNPEGIPILSSRGGMYLGTPTGLTARLAAPTFMHDPDDGTGDGTPAATGDTTAPAADAAAADPGVAPAGDATPDGTAFLPDGYADLDDGALRDTFNNLGAEVTAAAVQPEGESIEALRERVGGARARHAAQATITSILSARIDQRNQAQQELSQLPTLTLPEPVSEASGAPARAASAAAQPEPVSGGAPAPGSTAITAINERPTEPETSTPPLSRLASIVEITSRWRSSDSEDHGAAVTFRSMLNDTRPDRPASDNEHIGTLKPAAMASARVQLNPENTLGESPTWNERLIFQRREEHRQARADQGTVDSQGVARLAAICDPPTIYRDATTCGTDATPFQSSLVSLDAVSGNTLGFQYRLPTSMTEAQAGIGEWDTTKQAAIDRTNPDTWKPCVSIACPGYATEQAKEITACYEIDAFTELSSPEAEADFIQAKDRAFARYTEGWYLRKVDTFLKYVSFNGFTGSVPDVIEAVLTAIAQGDYGERLEPGTYTVFGSPGVLYTLTVDENKRAFRTGTAALADVQQIVQDATGTSYMQLWDRELASNGALKPNPFGNFGATGASSPTIMPKLNTVGFTLRIVDTSSLVRFTTGQAVFGQGITLDQARRNERGFFQRVFGGVMKPGCAIGYRVDITLCPDGSRGGFLPPGCNPTGFDPDDNSQFSATPLG